MLLHICCAPCSTHVINVLKDRYVITGFFYNPNIHPKEEYIRRLEEVRRFCSEVGMDLVEGEYKPGQWFELVRGHEKDPEGGERCLICYQDRLEETARYASRSAFEFFTTTLTVSPHKNSKSIFSIARRLAGKYNVEFYEEDFKKRDGFKKSVELSKKYHMHRQDYCGCIFSKRQRNR